MNTFGFVGLGLMGGSLAMAIRKAFNGSKILACDINSHSLQTAKKDAIIDEGFSVENVDKMLQVCDLVYICLYPDATIDFLKAHKDAFNKDAIITDIAGVKSKLIANIPEELKAQFIPGHPMAGNEREGYAFASGDVFQNRNYILLPLNNTPTQKLDELKRLITKIGFTRIIETDAKTHDHKIAFTSQLCHVIASALVTSAEDTEITEFGGGSFEDLTRIAMINAPLWTELFLSNKQELVKHIESFESSLQNLKSLISNDKPEELQEQLENVRAKRIVMSNL